MSAPKHTAGGRYVVEQVAGQGLCLRRNTVDDTVGFVVKFSTDGRVAWTGPKYFAAPGLKLGPLKGAATKAAKRWQAYYDRTGKRFEVEQSDKRAAEKAARTAELAARNRKRDAAEELYEALVRINARLSPSPDRTFDQLINDTDWSVAEARAAIAKATGEGA